MPVEIKDTVLNTKLTDLDKVNLGSIPIFKQS